MGSPSVVSHAVATALAQATTVDIFNERDHAKRRKLIEQNWSTNVLCYEYDKFGTGYEHAEKSINALTSDGREEWTCSFAGPIWVSGNLVHTDWVFGPGGNDSDVSFKGKDIFLVGKDDKIETLYVLINGPSTIAV